MSDSNKALDVKGNEKKKKERVNPFEHRTAKRPHFRAMNEKVRGNVTHSSLAQSTGQRKRQQHLLQEFHSRGKSGSYADRRLGEAGGNASAEGDSLTVEDKIEMRLRRVREQKARSMFSIDDGVSLSHFGQTLAGADLNDPFFFKVGDDEDFGGEGGLLDPDIVQELHFGGGEEEAAAHLQQQHKKKRSKREIMAALIAKSKVAKYERQLEREQLSMLSSKIDSEFDDVVDLLDLKPRKKKKKRTAAPSEAEFVRDATMEAEATQQAAAEGAEGEEEEQQADPFDALVALMKDEERSARAGKRLRTEEEIAKGRLEFMKQREIMRLKRMQGNTGDDEDEEGEDRGAFFGADEEAEDEDDEKFAEVISGRVWRREDDEEYSSGIDEDDTSIPFLINMPETLEAFQELMATHRDKRNIVLSRMISLHHPSLKPQHTKDLLLLQLYVIVSLLECTHDGQAAMQWAEIASRVCNRILRVVPSALVKQKHPLEPDVSFFYPYRLILAIVSSSGGPPPPRHPSEHLLYTNLRALASAKDNWGATMMISVVFPQLFSFSDASHPLASPAVMYLCNSLMRPHSTEKQLAKSLFICDRLLPLLSDGNRLAPEPVAFLTSLCSKATFVTASVPRPAKKLRKEAKKLLKHYRDLWWRVSPETLHASALSLGPEYESYSLPVVRMRYHKPIAVKTYEPLKSTNDKFTQMRKVRQQLKRETRAAAKELKRDREFLNAAKLEEYEKETASRAQSLKGIIGFLQDQQGEEKKLKRIKQQQLKM